MVDYEITKTKKLLEVNNSMCHNYYYLIYGRMINEEKTRMRKFKYVLWFDIFDLQEYYEKDFITKQDIKNYVNELSCSPLEYINDFNDEKNIKDFYKYCNETIQHYNDCIY